MEPSPQVTVDQFPREVIETVRRYVAALKGIAGGLFSLGYQAESDVLIVLGNDRLKRFGIQLRECRPYMLRPLNGTSVPAVQLGTSLLALNNQMRSSTLRCRLPHSPSLVPPIGEAYLVAFDAIAHRVIGVMPL
jgi:hypothetical protein